jgi:hypothetical protein
MGLAFEAARIALRIADGGDLANAPIANSIIALAKAVNATRRPVRASLTRLRGPSDEMGSLQSDAPRE